MILTCSRRVRVCLILWAQAREGGIFDRNILHTSTQINTLAQGGIPTIYLSLSLFFFQFLLRECFIQRVLINKKKEIWRLFLVDAKDLAGDGVQLTLTVAGDPAAPGR